MVVSWVARGMTKALYPGYLGDGVYRGNNGAGEDFVTINRIDVGARLSKVVIHGDTVYLAGLTADKTAGQSVGAQTQEILAAIDALLAKAGTDKSKLVQATIWLQDIRTVDEMNKVWDEIGRASCRERV